MSKIPIEKIRVTKRRRKDLGDIASLAASMKEIGLQHPIRLKPNLELVHGYRRLEAAKLLGWTAIEFTIGSNLADPRKALLAERDENSERKKYTPLEALDLKRALEPLERAEAAKRMKAGRPSAKLAEGEARVRAANATGYSHATLTKIEKVVQAAEAEPEKYREVAEKMERTGKISPAYKTVTESNNLRLQEEFYRLIQKSLGFCSRVKKQGNIISILEDWQAEDFEIRIDSLETVIRDLTELLHDLKEHINAQKKLRVVKRNP